MITGFNTDVKHKNRVFHIQTEDKGEGNPYVESLVYVGGEILATKRTSYAEVVSDRPRRPRDPGPHGAAAPHDDRGHPARPLRRPERVRDGARGNVVHVGSRAVDRGAAAAARRGRGRRRAAPAKAVKVEKPEKARPAKGEKGDATAPPGTKSPLAESDRSLDQMVLEYLVSDEVPEDVDLTLSPTPDFVAGRSVQTKLKATSGSPARPLAGASVSVRILSTSARASTAFQGKTAGDGSCFLSFMVPAFPNGNAAAVIRVTGGRASSEVQYSIKKK